MERLAALGCLWVFGLGAKEDYSAELDRLFLENPEDDLLLELEGLGDDRAAAWVRISPLIQEKTDVDVFGEELFGGLEKFCLENCGSQSSLEKFGKMCYAMWNAFPANIGEKDPFYTLCYADDPLSWGDEKQTRELYQKTFDHYYKETK